MNDENGTKMDDKTLLKIMEEQLADVACLAFELESEEGKALAFMVDSLLKLTHVLKDEGDILKAAACFETYQAESAANEY